MTILAWGGVLLCLAHSAIFSGLNLALMGIPRLRLEAEARTGSLPAAKILALRRDSNLLLTTLLWGNVGVNVLLTLLTGSLLTGAGAFLFSTIGITVIGEIVPQAYFSRNALRVGALLVPLVRFYSLLLFPVTKPTAMALDRWLGPEAVQYYRERDLREVIQLHAVADETDLGRAEAQGALNFLDLDDLLVSQEGMPIDPRSMIKLDDPHSLPLFQRSADDSFLRQIQASGEKWVVLIDGRGEPGLVIDADGFLRDTLLDSSDSSPAAYCHEPIVIRDPATRLGTALRRLRVDAEGPEDNVIDRDLILVWTSAEQRILTGADVLGRLLRGIVARSEPPALPPRVRTRAPSAG